MPIVIALLVWSLVVAGLVVSDQGCHTDTECASLCEADDPWCDGGPEK